MSFDILREVSGPVVVNDEGEVITGSVTSFDFVGAGVSTAYASGVTTVTIPGATAVALNDLNDVTITGATSGDVVSFNGSAWVNSSTLTGTWAGNVISVAKGGTNSNVASIGAFNNITGYAALGATGSIATNLVFSTSPTLVTPVLGAATATTLNGLTVTASTGTLTIANSSSLITSGGNSVTLTSTGSTNVTLPTSGTLGIKNQEIAVYGVGTAYQLTNSAAAIDFGTTDPVIVLNVAGTYEIKGQVHLAYTGATVAAETAAIKVRRTNNTAADLSVVVPIDLPASTTLTHSYGIWQIPPFIYTTAATDDSVTIFANVSAGLGAGTIDAIAIGTSLEAIRLY